MVKFTLSITTRIQRLGMVNLDSFFLTLHVCIDPRLPSAADAECPEYKRTFQQKLAFFRSQPELRVQKGQTFIDVTRENVFMDSFEQFMQHSPEDLRRKLTIRFDGEEGLDYGGVAREFFFLLSHEMFNPIYCLFEYSSHGKYTLQICPRSDINPEHLEYFKFIGRVVGVAIFHQRFLDAFFVSAVYKQVLGDVHFTRGFGVHGSRIVEGDVMDARE